MSRILITGAAGFIGSHIADRFHAAGHQVDGIDNLLTGHKRNVGHWNFMKGDVAAPDFAQWATALVPDVIVHCAASYSDLTDWHRDTNTNVNGAINVARAAQACGARVIYFQTALIYGLNPYDNHFGGPGEGETVHLEPLKTFNWVKPENSYAISKYAAGQYLRHSGVPLLEFRLANIYGPRNLSGPVPTFYKRVAAGEPCTIANTRRDFVYIQDLVELVDQAVDEEKTGTYHASTGGDYPIGQVYDAVVDAMDAYGGPDPEYREPDPGDVPTILLDPTETRRDFSWQATTDLDEGIEAAVGWYREHGVTDTYTHLAAH